jgi:hypothetical protein
MSVAMVCSDHEDAESAKKALKKGRFKLCCKELGQQMSPFEEAYVKDIRDTVCISNL